MFVKKSISTAGQELIKKSADVKIEEGRAMAELPFKVSNPEEFLPDHYNIAYKRMLSICRKYNKDAKIKDEIVGAFDKLRSRGHLKLYEDLNSDHRTKIESQTG